MKQLVTIGLSVGVAWTCSLAGFDAGSTAGKAAAEPAWKVVGQLEEACSCSPACPCWFKSRPSRMTCSGAQIIFITRGHYGPTSLDGLAVAQFAQSPEGKSMFESFGNWTFDYVYIDDKASPAQREALQKLAAHFFPPPAKEREFRYVPIRRRTEGRDRVSTVGTVAVCAGHLIEGGLGGPPKVVNPPLADPTHREFLQGATTKLTFTDAGQDWKFENSNYMRNEFVVDKEQYEKFDAALAKKMAAMKAATK